MQHRMTGRDWATLLLLSVIWGGSFFFIEVALQSVRPMTLVLIRVALAAAMLWAVFWVKRDSQSLPREALTAFLILALFNNVLPFLFFAYGQTQIASGLASILNATTPIWGVIVAHLFTADEKVTPGKALGLALGFGGVIVMIGGSFLEEIGADLLAELACLAATLCYALAGVYGRRFRTMGIAPMSVARGQLSAATLVMLPLVLIFERPDASALPSGTSIAALVALALVCTAFAYILYFRLLASAGATNSLLVTFLIPITAILLGSLVLGEVLETRHFAGMALIALGLAAIDGRLVALLRPSAPRKAA